VTERRRLSFAGHVSVSVILDKSNELLVDPQVSCLGIPATDHNDNDMEDIIYDAVVSAVESMPRGRRKDLDLIEDSVTRAVRGTVRNIWGKKPIVTVMVDKV
jgi:ribonuclease J